MHGDDPAWYRLPEERELAAQYLLLYELSLPYGLDLGNQLNIDKSQTMLNVTLINLSSAETRAFAARAEGWLETQHPELATHGVSPTIMFSHVSETNIQSMLSGTLIGLVVISGILMFALRSFRTGLISLVPNLLPAGLAFGLWGLFVGQINMAVSVVSAMTFGIVVDDTVHFLSKYLRARREKGLDREAAVQYAFENVGVALVITTVVLIAGFAILSLSSFGVNAQTAQLTVMTISIALVVDFLLLPPLLMAFDRRQRGPVNEPETVHA
jgi:predicted RND superfamily exporter protein